MKKIKLLVTLLVSILLLASISTVCFAEGENVIADDYSYIVYNGVKYVRVSYGRDNVEMAYTYVDDNEWYDVTLTEAQESVLDNIEINVGDEIARVYYNFDEHTGRSFAYYVREDLIDVYNAVAKGEYSRIRAYVKQSTDITREQLEGESVSMSGIELFKLNAYNVYNSSEDAEMKKIIGRLAYDVDGSCYYLDYKENGITTSTFSSLDYDKLVLHKITDEMILGLDDVEIVKEKDSAALIATVVMLSLIFILIPLGVLIFLVVRKKKENGLYLKLFRIAIILGVALIVISVILAFMVIPYI